MTKAMANTYPVKSGKIGVRHPAVSALMLSFSILLLGFPPVLLLMNAHSLQGLPFILLSLFYVVSVCTAYAFIVLNSQASKLKREIGKKALAELYPSLNRFEERKAAFLSAFGISPDWDYVPKSERKAFFVNTGYGAVKLGKIKAGKPVLQAILVAIPMAIGIVVITPLIFCIEGPLFIVAVCGYLLVLFGVNIAVRLPSILRKEKELLGDEFYYFHPVLKRIKKRKERIAARAAEKAEIMKNDKPIQGKIFAMNATLQSLLWTLGMCFAFFPIYLLIAYAEDIGGILYMLLWGVYLGLMTLAYGIIDAKKRRRIEKIYEEDAKNCEKTKSGDIHKFQ